MPAFRWMPSTSPRARTSSASTTPHVTRTFCKNCGATLQFVDNRENELGIAAGTLDSPLGVPEQSHIYVDSKADWYEIRDGLPQHRGDL